MAVSVYLSQRRKHTASANTKQIRNDSGKTTMQKKSLASALSAALAKPHGNPAARTDRSPLLLNAIKNSTTRMDQIVQRRIGLQSDLSTDLEKSRQAGNATPTRE